MKVSHPPRLATALLRRAFDEDEPLVGDLLEGFARNRSRLWFWRQTMSAMLFRSRQRRDETHPLGLAPRSDAGDMYSRTPLQTRVNLTASPLPDIGGLGLVVFAALVAVVRPGAWWIFLPAIAGGVLIGISMVIVRRHQR